MFTNRSFNIFIIAALVVAISVTACSPKLASTPISSTTSSFPAATLTPIPPTAVASPAVEASPRVLSGHRSDIWGLDISRDGKHLVTGSADRTARLWNLASGETIREFEGHPDEVWGVAFSPDGKYIVTTCADGIARLWDVASGEIVQKFTGKPGGLDAPAFSPDGKYIVTAGGEDLTARIWDVATGETLHILSGHTIYVPCVAYSPDGKYVLTAGGESARLWDAATGSEVQVFPGADYNGFSTVAISSDGKYIATGSDDQIARVWDIPTGEMVREFSGHEGFVNAVKFSPDGRFLLTGSGDHIARLWDVASGQSIQMFEGHKDDVQGVAFSPDGQLVITASGDGTIRVWNVQTSSVVVPDSNEAGITLRLAVADGGGRPSEPYVLEFVEQVKTISNGEVIIEPIWEAGNTTGVGFETGVIQLVKAGKAELGLAGSRAFDNESITSFQALQAPFLITNDALSKAVATSDIATRMLDNLTSAGLMGMTIWPEDLRHPFSIIPDKPLLSPENFAGLDIRVTPSHVSSMLIETLGGKPTFEDDYEGAESGLRQGASLNGNPTATGNVTFFAKFQVLFANGAIFEKLSEQQRAVLSEAAGKVQQKAIAEHPSEADAAIAWCADGGSIVMASEEQVVAFEESAQPVFDSILQNPLNAELITAIRELKANTEPSPGADGCAP